MNELTDIVFKRVDGKGFSNVREDIALFNVFMAIDGRRSVKTIAGDDDYEIDSLASKVNQLEKLGLIVPVDGAVIEDNAILSQKFFSQLPPEFYTGIDAVDTQHQRIVDMVNQLNMVRKANYKDAMQKNKAVGDVIAEMIDYTLSHFAFEEELMENAEYMFYKAHKRIHNLFVQRAMEYKERFVSGEDIADELYDTLTRWLFNHIRNDDKAYAQAVKMSLKKLGRSKYGWLGRMIKKFFNE